MSSRFCALDGRPAVWYASLLVACSLCAPSAAHAQAAIGLMGGTEYGFGATARFGTGPFRVEGGAGFTPVWITVDVTGGDDIFNIYLPATVGGKAALRVGHIGVAHLEVEGGATYSTFLKMGYGGGINLRRSGMRFVLSAGIMVYPDAKEEMRLRINEDEGTSFTPDQFSVPLAAVQPYVGVAIYLGRP